MFSNMRPHFHMLSLFSTVIKPILIPLYEHVDISSSFYPSTWNLFFFTIMCLIVASFILIGWVAPRKEEIEKWQDVNGQVLFFCPQKCDWNVIISTPRSPQSYYGPPFVCHNIWALVARPQKPCWYIIG